jgi:hypothetical protein
VSADATKRATKRLLLAIKILTLSTKNDWIFVLNDYSTTKATIKWADTITTWTQIKWFSEPRNLESSKRIMVAFATSSLPCSNKDRLTYHLLQSCSHHWMSEPNAQSQGKKIELFISIAFHAQARLSSPSYTQRALQNKENSIARLRVE